MKIFCALVLKHPRTQTIDNSQGIKTKLIYSFLNSIIEWQKSRWRGFWLYFVLPSEICLVDYRILQEFWWPYGCCYCSVPKLCLTLCDPMDCSMPGFPVLHYLPEFAQTHVHRVSDAISSPVAPFSSCLQSFPASGSFPMSQLFASDGWSIGASASASVLPRNIQGWFNLGWTGLISMMANRLSRVFSNTMVRKHQFGTQPSLWSNPHIHTWLLEKP